MNEKISLAGDLGSGKSTVSDILTEELGAEYYSTGAIVRSIASKRGMSVVELNVYMETHPEIDNEIDDGLVRLAEVDKPLVIDSRMAWHFTPNTFKVYLSTDTETSALRIMNANRTGEHNATLEETVRSTRARRESEKKRYLEQYGVDIKDLTNYDLIVDTTNITPREVADCILFAFAKWKTDKEYRVAYISPERLNYPDTQPDNERVLQYVSDIENYRTVPAVEVFECENEFYVEGNFEVALAYALNLNSTVPCRIVKGECAGRKFVKMKNSL